MKEWNIEDIEKKEVLAVYEADRLRRQQEQVIKDAQTILTLLENNYVSACRKLINTYDYMAPSFKQAQDELKITDRRKKRPALNLITSHLSEDFFQGRSLVITDILQCGLNAQAFQATFKFEGNEQKYFVQIPMHEKLNSLIDVRYYMNYQFGTFNDSPRWLEIKCKALTAEELSQQIKKYFEGVKE